MPESLYQKKTLAHVLSCEFCEIFKNTFFFKTPPVGAFDSRSTWEFLAVVSDTIARAFNISGATQAVELKV